MECSESLRNVRGLLLELYSLAQKLYYEAHGSRSFYYLPYTGKKKRGIAALYCVGA